MYKGVGQDYSKKKNSGTFLVVGLVKVTWKLGFPFSNIFWNFGQFLTWVKVGGPFLIGSRWFRWLDLGTPKGNLKGGNW